VNGKPKPVLERVQYPNIGEPPKFDVTNSDLNLPAQDDDGIMAHIDPRLFSLADTVSHIIANVNDEAVQNDEIEGMILEKSDESPDLPSAVNIPGIDFVSFFSRINVLSNKRLASSKSKGIPDMFRGNGKDEPTLFQHKCRRIIGCDYSTDNHYHLLVHEARCSVERVKKIGTTALLYKCSVRDCDASFETEAGLQYHQKTQHSYKPRACRVEGCDPGILYHSRNAFRKHQTAFHPSWTPKRCPVDACACTIEFANAQTLKTHLQVTHKMEDKALLKSHTYVRTLSFPPQRCSYPGCGHETVYKEKRRLIIHLQKSHGVAKDESTTYITLE
jgi:hypothetical protein